MDGVLPFALPRTFRANCAEQSRWVGSCSRNGRRPIRQSPMRRHLRLQPRNRRSSVAVSWSASASMRPSRLRRLPRCFPLLRFRPKRKGQGWEMKAGRVANTVVNAVNAVGRRMYAAVGGAGSQWDRSANEGGPRKNRRLPSAHPDEGLGIPMVESDCPCIGTWYKRPPRRTAAGAGCYSALLFADCAFFVRSASIRPSTPPRL